MQVLQTLEQDKLNATDKKSANFFNWRGQFTPEFVGYMIDCYADDNDFVVDPFSGSGTVLFECAKRNLKCVGLDINPAAFIMSKFYSYSNISLKQRMKIINDIELEIEEVLPNYINRYILKDGLDYRTKYLNYLDFSSSIIRKTKDKVETDILLNVLFFAEKLHKKKIPVAIRESFAKVKRAFIDLPVAHSKIQAFCCDARLLENTITDKVSLIITSPPYINVFNYHQNYRAIIELLNYDILTIANSEFGSNRKNRGNRFRTVIQYCLDMEQSLLSIWKSLKPNGKVIMVVGRQSKVKGVPFYNSKIIADLIHAGTGFEVLDVQERSFSNKFGQEIVEDILIFKKAFKETRKKGIGKIVASNTLIKTLKKSKLSTIITNEIQEAISDIDEISESPILPIKGDVLCL